MLFSFSMTFQRNLACKSISKEIVSSTGSKLNCKGSLSEGLSRLGWPVGVSVGGVGRTILNVGSRVS